MLFLTCPVEGALLGGKLRNKDQSMSLKLGLWGREVDWPINGDGCIAMRSICSSKELALKLPRSQSRLRPREPKSNSYALITLSEISTVGLLSIRSNSPVALVGSGSLPRSVEMLVLERLCEDRLMSHLFGAPEGSLNRGLWSQMERILALLSNAAGCQKWKP